MLSQNHYLGEIDSINVTDMIHVQWDVVVGPFRDTKKHQF